MRIVDWLHVIAAPIYVLRAVAAIWRAWRLRRLLRHGYVECPHCGEANALDVLAKCPKCHTVEYGNRLRCTACGSGSAGFLCDECGVAIRMM